MCISQIDNVDDSRDQVRKCALSFAIIVPRVYLLPAGYSFMRLKMQKSKQPSCRCICDFTTDSVLELETHLIRHPSHVWASEETANLELKKFGRHFELTA